VTGAAPRAAIVARHPWRSEALGAARLHYAGHPPGARALAGEILATADEAGTRAALARARGLFAIVLETQDGVLAACDAIRSTPVFFARAPDGGAIVSNDARALSDAPAAPDPDALLEIEMAGFVTGDATVYGQIRQIAPGGFARFGARAFGPSRYRRYLPAGEERHADPAAALGAVLDRAFAELAARTEGKRVLVPVSGGLDSRLVLAKLKEHGCRALESFSYGMPGNTDAAAGRAVAERLGVPWRFVESRPAAHRDFFRSGRAREFWRFADGLSCVPSPQDIVPFAEMRAAGLAGPDTVVVNGQTGDFLSGGHIPAALLGAATSRDALTAAILDKHYALWRSLGTPENRARMAARIEAAIGLPVAPEYGRDEAVARYELWEFEGRQARWVVNAQRTYEYLGLGWELPLWQPALIEFFRDLPVDLKIGQRCYRDYLGRWDYAGLFAGLARARSSWPGPRRVFAALEKAASIAGGPGAQARANRVLRYFGHYAYQYRELGFSEFLRVRDDMRHIVAHHATRWLEWNGFPSARRR
jgi:asparagine synthase (glutamine-hydrolysing)